MEWDMFNQATAGGENKPHSVTYQKDAGSVFYRVFAYNRRPDMEPVNPVDQVRNQRVMEAAE